MVTKSCLPLCIITSSTALISEANQLHVDRIMIDLERLGKARRQMNKGLFISNHTEMDIPLARSILTHTQLMVRINPIHPQSESEINRCLGAGADILMLPCFVNATDVTRFIDCIAGRSKTSLLLETKEAINNIDDILAIPGIDEIHIGLNDLHISLNNQTIFDVILDGTVEKLAAKIKPKNIKFGYGGVAPPAFPMPISPEAVIAEQVRLQSSLAILSRKVSSQLEKNNVKHLSFVIAQIEAIARKWQNATSSDFIHNREEFRIQ